MRLKQPLKGNPRIYRTADLYKEYARLVLKENPEYWGGYSKPHKMSNYWVFRREGHKVIEVISYPVFRRVLEEYFTAAKLVIIEGGELNLGNNLGVIAARRVERNHKNKVINYQATALQPKNAQGKPEKIVYYTDDDWCRIGWRKSGKVRNHKFYKFEPTPDDGRGGGFRAEFSRALMLNPLLKYKYRYYPYILDI